MGETVLRLVATSSPSQQHTLLTDICTTSLNKLGRERNRIQYSQVHFGWQLSKMSLVSMSLQTLAQTLLLLSWNAVRVTQQ